MFSHIHIGITDFERAFDFYSAVLEELNLKLKFNDPEQPWAAWKAEDHPRPLFVIGRPFDKQPAAPGNGHMVALLAESRSQVDRCYTIAIELGGVCVKVRRGCDRSIMRIITVPISEIRTATSSVSVVIRHERSNFSVSMIVKGQLKAE